MATESDKSKYEVLKQEMKLIRDDPDTDVCTALKIQCGITKVNNLQPNTPKPCIYCGSSDSKRDRELNEAYNASLVSNKIMELENSKDTKKIADGYNPKRLNEFFDRFEKLEERDLIDYHRADLKFAWSNSGRTIPIGYTEGQVAFSDGVQVGAALLKMIQEGNIKPKE